MSEEGSYVRKISKCYDKLENLRKNNYRNAFDNVNGIQHNNDRIRAANILIGIQYR